MINKNNSTRNLNILDKITLDMQKKKIKDSSSKQILKDKNEYQLKLSKHFLEFELDKINKNMYLDYLKDTAVFEKSIVQFIAQLALENEENITKSQKNLYEQLDTLNSKLKKENDLINYELLLDNINKKEDEIVQLIHKMYSDNSNKINLFKEQLLNILKNTTSN